MSSDSLQLTKRPVPLSHVVEPNALLLTWQPVGDNSRSRLRRIVARIERQADGGAKFRYMPGTEDFESAVDEGFEGHPAFKLDAAESNVGVLETLLRRLPPRKREDFAEFLATHRLPVPFEYSDFALLGYTGARLPSDGFSIVPVIEQNQVPCDLILEVAGFRHEPGASADKLAVGDEVSFECEDDNPYDANALAIMHRGHRIGYVNRAMNTLVRAWLQHQRVSAKVERVNGKPERPLIYLRLEVR